MPPRYLEPLVPPAAAVLGIGVGYLASLMTGAAKTRRDRLALLVGSLALAAALAATLIYQASTHALPPAASIGAAGAAAAIVVTLALAASGSARRWAPGLGALTALLAVVSVLALPLAQSSAIVRTHASDGGSLGSLPPNTTTKLSNYLTKHRGSARYEFAAATASLAAPLIVADGQPVMILAGTPFHLLAQPADLSRAVRAGEVKYALISNTASSHPVRPYAPRSPRSLLPSWVVNHGVDVTRQAGLHGYGMLYRLGR
jgi:hypothetical protein